jgi:hypothetical protein
MLPARVDYTPQKEIYNPGDVLNVALRFAEPFVGQCEASLTPKSSAPRVFPATAAILARSGPTLYEGQVHVRAEHVGRCVLLARLTPVHEQPAICEIGDRTFYVRRIRP